MSLGRHGTSRLHRFNMQQSNQITSQLFDDVLEGTKLDPNHQELA